MNSSLFKNILLCLIGLGPFVQPIRAQPAQPNIVYILADDLGYGDVSLYNPDGRIKTPHIDARARPGMRLILKSVVSGTSVSVRVDLGGRRFITKKKKIKNKTGHI